MQVQLLSPAPFKAPESVEGSGVFLLERGISDEKGELGKQKQEKLCKIWEINDDETNCILTKLKRHKIIKKLSKSVDKRGILGYNNIRRR